MNSAEKPHWDADSSVSSVLRRSPVFRISKQFLSKFITRSRLCSGPPRPAVSSRPSLHHLVCWFYTASHGFRREVHRYEGDEGYGNHVRGDWPRSSTRPAEQRGGDERR